MGASGWDYFVPYQENLENALQALRRKVFEEGDYWWAGGEFGQSASACPDRPATMQELFEDERVHESGTHSILDMFRVLQEGAEPKYGTIQMVSAAEAMSCAGTQTLTRQHVEAIDRLAERRWMGRGAILHDEHGKPAEIYFWGFSGD